MAKGDEQPKTTGTAFGAGVSTTASQLPQENQTLQGNPGTDPNAQTRWMDPTQQSDTGGFAGGGGVKQASQAQPIQDGTMLGQITSGSVGQYMPQGYDQTKFGMTEHTTPKYEAGRILSKYPPGPEGLQAARQELAAAGYEVVGRDKIRINKPGQYGGEVIDVGQNFSDPNAQHNWWWSGDTRNQGQSMPGQGQAPGNSMFGQQQGNNNNFLQQMFQQMMSQRNQAQNQQFNPTGGQSSQQGQIPPLANTGFAEMPGGFRGNTQPQYPMSDQYAMPQLGGGPKGGSVPPWYQQGNIIGGGIPNMGQNNLGSSTPGFQIGPYGTPR